VPSTGAQYLALLRGINVGDMTIRSSGTTTKLLALMDQRERPEAGA
jgi:hypothetical protein